MKTDLTVWEIAQVCHEANRALQNIFMEEKVSPPWLDTTVYTQESAVSGVNRVLENPSITPAELHQEWVEYKRSQGYVWGPNKSEEKLTHPCMKPYGDLPRHVQLKDRVFLSIVRTFINNYDYPDHEWY